MPFLLEAEAYLRNAYPNDRPGVVVLLAVEGKVVFRAAYGLADVRHNTPLSVHDVFRIGSLTKQFTAAAILLLEERGLLKVQDRLQTHLPSYPDLTGSITLEHLLNHTSGIPSYTDRDDFEELEGLDLSQQEVLETFQNEPPLFKPGAEFSYSNSGYFLLGMVIERLSGTSLATFFHQEIFRPLGMLSTAMEGHGGVWPIQGYTEEPDLQLAPAISMTIPYASGAIVSTLGDMFVWEQGMARAKLLAHESWQRMWNPTRLTDGEMSGYGYGFEQRCVHGIQVIDHDGGINGFNSYSARTLDRGVFVCVLSNNDSGQPSTIEVGEHLIRMGQKLRFGH
jgi:CubicO group peptidase (beta-lactamase class C family)